MKKSIVLGALLLPALSFGQKNIPYHIKGQMGHMDAPAKAHLEYFKDGNVYRENEGIDQRLTSNYTASVFNSY